jgi:threonine synthase
MASVCRVCGQPLFPRYDIPLAPRAPILPRWDMWRYAALMPVAPGEEPVTLGEGCTPLIEFPELACSLGVRRLWIKNEAKSPTSSFKARGMSAAVTRARGDGVPGIVVPTAGNAGAALAAYAAAARLPARVYAPKTTPQPILRTIVALGAELQLVDGHIGDAGRQARAFADETGYFDISTLREPYRLEGKKTMGFELAEQLGWRLPDVIVYPTGGGIAVIAMWKAFAEMRDAGWIATDAPLPRMIVAQSSGCAPLVRAFTSGADRAMPWENPETHAAGLRVPAPLGDRLILRVLRASGGDAIDVGEDDIRSGQARLARATGIDVAPEAGCAFDATARLVRSGRIAEDSEVVVFNTGSGLAYRG